MVSFANYLAELGDKAQSEIFTKSRSTCDAGRVPQDAAIPDDDEGLSEDEAISLMSVAVDFA